MSEKQEYFYHDAQAGHHHAYLLPLVLEIFNTFSTKEIKILDLGCGNGSFDSALYQHGYHNIVGVDDSESGIKAAQTQFPYIKFIHGSIYNIPKEISKDTFDVVLSLEVIEHLYQPRELIKSAKRSIKSGGSLILSTPYHGYLKNLVLSLTGKMDQHFTALWDGGHIKFFSVATLTELLKQEDLTEIKFYFAGRMPLLWKTMCCNIKVK